MEGLARLQLYHSYCMVCCQLEHDEREYTLMSKNCKSQKSKIIITVQRRAFVFYCKSSPKLSKLMSILVTAAEEHSGFASFGKQLKWYTQAIAYFYFLYNLIFLSWVIMYIMFTIGFILF